VSEGKFSELIGKRIIAFLASPDREDIGFVCEDGSEFRYHAEGDCCSTSWVEHVTGLALCVGATVAEVIEKPMVDNINAEVEMDRRDECVEVWGYTLVTSRGYLDLEFRNGSNGYYGGWIEAAGSDLSGLEIVTVDF
jgi:hypothetical protein